MQNRRSFLTAAVGAAAVPAAAATAKPDWHSIPVADSFEIEHDREGAWSILRYGNLAMRILLISPPSAD